MVHWLGAAQKRPILYVILLTEKAVVTIGRLLRKEKMMSSKVDEVIPTILAFVLILALYAVLTAYPVMLLWNWVVPEIFGLPEIGFWQALGLQALSAFLFKNTSNSSSKKK